MKNRKLPLILGVVLLFVVVPAASGQEQPTTIDELTGRMKLALTNESPGEFLSLFWQKGMDERVRTALSRAFSRHAGDEVVGVQIKPPGDCSWCTYERDGVTYTLPFQPDGWIHLEFSYEPPEPSVTTWTKPELGFPFKNINGQYFLLCSLPQEDGSDTK